MLQSVLCFVAETPGKQILLQVRLVVLDFFMKWIFFLHHKETEWELYGIYEEGMSSKSGCEPSCEEWFYTAAQQSDPKESKDNASNARKFVAELISKFAILRFSSYHCI